MTKKKVIFINKFQSSVKTKRDKSYSRLDFSYFIGKTGPLTLSERMEILKSRIHDLQQAVLKRSP